MTWVIQHTPTGGGDPMYYRQPLADAPDWTFVHDARLATRYRSARLALFAFRGGLREPGSCCQPVEVKA